MMEHRTTNNIEKAGHMVRYREPLLLQSGAEIL